VLGRIAAHSSHVIRITPFTGAGVNANAQGESAFDHLLGAGSDVALHYTPWIWGAASPWGGQFASDPDDVLLHELVHAMREVQGEFNQLKTRGGDADYDDDEEFLAILLTNIALSEKDPSAPLRRDHHGHVALPDNESTSRGFLVNHDQTDNLFWIRFLYPQEFDLFNQVAASDFAGFNPINEFLSHPERYAPGEGAVNNAADQAADGARNLINDGENAVDQGADWLRHH
jgi:hypothetical protein